MATLCLPNPEDIAKEDIPAVLSGISALALAISARMFNDHAEPEPREEDVLVTTVQAAALLSVRPDWLYEKAGNLPFTRRLSRKCLRFSRRGLLAWRDKRKG